MAVYIPYVYFNIKYVYEQQLREVDPMGFGFALDAADIEEHCQSDDGLADSDSECQSINLEGSIAHDEEDAHDEIELEEAFHVVVFAGNIIGYGFSIEYGEALKYTFSA